MKNLSLFLLLLGILVACQKWEINNYRLFVTLKDAPFDSLYIADYGKYGKTVFEGHKIEDFTWKFIIPDSISHVSERILFFNTLYNSETNSKIDVRFHVKYNQEQIVLGSINIDDNHTYIYAEYAGQTVSKNEHLKVVINDKEESILVDHVFMEFNLLIDNDNSDISIRVQNPLLPWPYEVSYDDYLTQCILLAQKHPDSKYLMINLSKTLFAYHSAEDIRKVYDSLSDKYKNTQWGRSIEDFLFRKFENALLPTLNRMTEEEIVQDNSKYNLIIFIASWCRPCIEEIPILKEIHHDLTENLIITYVSVDEIDTVDDFQKLMQTREIPWRALLAFQDTHTIKKKYFANAIPHGVLIYPNGEKMDKIDVRVKENRDKLYSLCGLQP